MSCASQLAYHIREYLRTVALESFITRAWNIIGNVGREESAERCTRPHRPHPRNVKVPGISNLNPPLKLRFREKYTWTLLLNVFIDQKRESRLQDLV